MESMQPLSEMSTAGPGDVSGCEGVVMAIDPLPRACSLNAELPCHGLSQLHQGDACMR